MSLEDIIKELTPEQRGKAAQCKNTEEFAALARDENIELDIETLDAIAGAGEGGGANCEKIKCPRCGSHKHHIAGGDPLATYRCMCDECGYIWEV